MSHVKRQDIRKGFGSKGSPSTISLVSFAQACNGQKGEGGFEAVAAASKAGLWVSEHHAHPLLHLFLLLRCGCIFGTSLSLLSAPPTEKKPVHNHNTMNDVYKSFTKSRGKKRSSNKMHPIVRNKMIQTSVAGFSLPGISVAFLRPMSNLNASTTMLLELH